MATQTFELAKKSGICFVFGFPNANSLPGFIKKLNWVEHSRLSIFTLHVNTIPISSVASKSALLLRGYRKLIMLFWNRYRLKSFTSNSVIGDGFGGLLRDANHFNYKKYESNAAFQIHGVPVWLKIDHRLLIGDIAACDERTFNSIIRTLKFIARISGIRRIVFIANNDLSIAIRFASIRGVENATTLPYCYLNDYTSINPDAIRFTTADWDTF